MYSTHLRIKLQKDLGNRFNLNEFWELDESTLELGIKPKKEDQGEIRKLERKNKLLELENKGLIRELETMKEMIKGERIYSYQWSFNKYTTDSLLKWEE
jgi:hypothetical protein